MTRTSGTRQSPLPLDCAFNQAAHPTRRGTSDRKGAQTGASSRPRCSCGAGSCDTVHAENGSRHAENRRRGGTWTNGCACGRACWPLRVHGEKETTCRMGRGPAARDTAPREHTLDAELLSGHLLPRNMRGGMPLGRAKGHAIGIGQGVLTKTCGGPDSRNTRRRMRGGGRSRLCREVQRSTESGRATLLHADRAALALIERSPFDATRRRSCRDGEHRLREEPRVLGGKIEKPRDLWC